MIEETAQYWRDLAKQQRAERLRSQDESDTDGFLTQWSCSLTAEKYDQQADIVDRGGKWDFIGLYEGDRRVIAKIISGPKKFAPWETEYSWCVHNSDPVSKVRKYIPVGENSRIQKKLGLSERSELQTAEAALTGRGTGLSGSAWVTVNRIGDEWGREAELIVENPKET